MTFEDFDYVELDYDDDTFTIVKEGHTYTYDINEEIGLYNQILGNDEVYKYEVYSQEEDFYFEDSNDRSVDDDIKDLWKQLEDL